MSANENIDIENIANNLLIKAYKVDKIANAIDTIANYSACWLYDLSTVDDVADLLGVPPETCNDDNQEGYIRDWLTDMWHEKVLTDEITISCFISALLEEALNNHNLKDKS